MAVSELVRKPLTISKTTFFLYTSVLVLGQLLFSAYTVNVAGNRDVLDYLSFAGTVIGIVLAVLAIVYSYFATITQKDDAESLRSQISSLGSTVLQASNTSTQLGSELQRLKDISEQLKGMAEVYDRIDKNVASLAEKEFAEKKQARKETPRRTQAQPAARPATPSEPAEITLVRKATREQALQMALAAIDLTADLSEDEALKESISTLRRAVLSDGAKEDVEKFIIDLGWGAVLCYYFVFHDLDVTSDARLRALRRALRAKLDEFPAGETSTFTAEAIAEKLAILKDALERADGATTG
ncbi:hypothetical protein [Lysobacter arvi]|uniref:Uncharacterized protein n=1 Tax=Lysobacter arvi TaxID=3038776 RepID=A0ABU1CA11_9GAMM|nr:hypothetical protein [Lysobacter arvi]MDR0182024.1 hypothetical protein [Lysobacter arvi]